MTIENTKTRHFKKWLLEMLKDSFLMVFLIICTHKLVSFLVYLRLGIISYISVIIGILLGAILLIRIIISAKNMHKSGTMIMSYMRGDMNIERADNIIKKLSLGFVVIFIGLFSPVLLIAANLPEILYITSFTIIAVGIIILSSVIKSIKRATKSRYKYS